LIITTQNYVLCITKYIVLN